MVRRTKQKQRRVVGWMLLFCFAVDFAAPPTTSRMPHSEARQQGLYGTIHYGTIGVQVGGTTKFLKVYESPLVPQHWALVHLTRQQQI